MSILTTLPPSLTSFLLFLNPAALLHSLFTSPSFVATLLLLTASFHFLAAFFHTPKQHAWILTTLASALMTLASLPFVRDYLRAGADVLAVQPRTPFAVGVNRVFQAYLLADLTMGAVYYRKQVFLLTGWIHHAAYILIVECAIRNSWSHIFCFAACMELPTFTLALASLFPSLRSNSLFTATFFTTRIFLHSLLINAYLISPRAIPVVGSRIPGAILACAFPMHVMWFKGALMGFVKRARARNGVAVPLAKEKGKFAMGADSEVHTSTPALIPPIDRTLAQSPVPILAPVSVQSPDSAPAHAHARTPLHKDSEKENIRPTYISPSPQPPSQIRHRPLPQRVQALLSSPSPASTSKLPSSPPTSTTTPPRPALPPRRPSLERARLLLQTHAPSLRRRIRIPTQLPLHVQLQLPTHIPLAIPPIPIPERLERVYARLPDRRRVYEYVGLGVGGGSGGAKAKKERERERPVFEGYGNGNMPGGIGVGVPSGIAIAAY